LYGVVDGVKKNVWSVLLVWIWLAFVEQWGELVLSLKRAYLA